MYPVLSYVHLGPKPLTVFAQVPDPIQPCHRYEISAFDSANNQFNDFSQPSYKLSLVFQNGPQIHSLPNGITMETLLAVCHDRLNRFQMGQYPSSYNATAMFHIQQALAALNQRTMLENAGANLNITTQPT
jgi:hypothetical protein